MNESSSQPPSFQIPSGDEVLPEENMDEFKAYLNKNERAKYIIASYLNIWPDQFNLWSLKNFRAAYPVEFDPLVGRIQNLIDRHGYTKDTIRHELLEWLAVVGWPSSITEVITPTAPESQSTVVPAEGEVAGMREELERLTVPVEKEPVDVHASTVSSSRPQELQNNQAKRDIFKFMKILLSHGQYILYHTSSFDEMTRYAEASPNRLAAEVVHSVQTELYSIMQHYGLSEAEVYALITEWFQAEQFDPEAARYEITFIVEDVRKTEPESGPPFMSAGVTQDIAPKQQITIPSPPEDNDPKGVAFSKKGKIRGRVMTESPWGAPPAEEPVRGQQKTMQVAFTEEGVIVPFVRQRNDKPITRSQWQSDIGPQLQEEVTPFFDKLIPEGKRLLAAVLNTQDLSDPEEVARMIMNHAPKSNANAFRLMNKHVTRFIERLGRPEEEVRKALGIKLEGGHVLPEPAPKKPGINPRKQKTILSTRVQIGILNRFLGKKK